MDMKHILQAFDNASTKPVEGANDMSRFLSIVDNASKKETLTEAASPHRVSLPVQMAMQHYQQPKKEVAKSDNLLKKYFESVETDQAEELEKKQAIIRQYSRVIAERVMSRK